MTTQLIETYRGRVAVWECDHLGHMNVQFYVARISDAPLRLSGAIGVTAAYVRERRRALATVHQDISFITELKPGDLIAMHGAVLSVEGKKLRFLHRMTRVEDGRHVMTAKVLMVGMDLEQRKSVVLDDFVAESARKLLVEETTS